jgi:hypothetical protein
VSDNADFYTNKADDAVQKLDDEEGINHKQVSTDINQESTTHSGRNIRKPASYRKDFDTVAVDNIYDIKKVYRSGVEVASTGHSEHY